MGRGLTKNPLYLLIFSSFVLLVVLPVVYTIATGVFVDDFAETFSTVFNVKSIQLLTKSVAIAFLIAILSTILGTILGFILYKTNVRFRAFFKIGLLIPLFISPYILAVAWKDFFFMAFSNSTLLSSYFGVVLVMTSIYTPLAMLITGSALSNIDMMLEESALMITNFRSAIFKIILPIIKPSLISSFVLVFIFSISEFSVPSYFGIKVFTTEIFTQFSAFYNHSYAIMQSLFLIIICVSLLYSERKYIANAPFLSIGSKGTNNKLYTLNHQTRLMVLLVLVGSFVLTVIMPFTILFIQSFKNGFSRFIQAFGLLKPTFLESTSIAFIGAIFIVIVGFSSAYYSAKQSKGITIFDWLLLFIFAIPSIVFGISLIKFYNHPGLDFIYSSTAIILIAYVGKFSFIASKLISNAIGNIPKSLNEASQIQGVSSSVYIRKILIPLILPTLFVTFIIGFIFSFGELSTSIMLYPPGTELMSIKVFTIMANAPQDLTSSMVLIVFSITLLIISGFYFMAKPIFKKYNYTND